MAQKRLVMMGVRSFRDSFSTLTEPVQVIRSTRKGSRPQEILGTWTPEPKHDERNDHRKDLDRA